MADRLGVATVGIFLSWKKRAPGRRSLPVTDRRESRDGRLTQGEAAVRCGSMWQLRMPAGHGSAREHVL